ncbi:Mov34/MPN/PAD-1 family protein [uncultured Alistipes sp.]|uniref:Mov34/MPN/PAD-1 family protein n=1 Tax=uncultured Alistipes sp. TaxID=538949 RepID=UPI003450066D
MVYVGEWHTHPENVPSPSATDLKSIKNIYNTTNLNSDIIVYIIIGRQSEYYGCYDGQMHYTL